MTIFDSQEGTVKGKELKTLPDTLISHYLPQKISSNYITIRLHQRSLLTQYSNNRSYNVLQSPRTQVIVMT